MKAEVHHIKQGSLIPALDIVLESAGAPINLAGVSSVTLRAQKKDNPAVGFSGPCTIVDATLGTISYA